MSESVNLLFWSGQSNAMDRGNISTNCPALIGETLDVYIMKADTFDQITYGTNQNLDATKWNFETSLAPQLVTKYGKPVYCFDSYVLGAPLGLRNPNAPYDCYLPYISRSNYFANLIKVMSKAFAQLRLLNKVVDKIFFVWFQGEADSPGTALAPIYRSNVELLDKAVRHHIKIPMTSVILGINDQYGPYLPGADTVIAAQQDYANTYPDIVKFLDNRGLPTLDLVHFTEASYKQIGNNVFNII